MSATAVVLAVVLRRLVTSLRLPQIDMLAVLVITGLVAYLAGWSTPGANGHTAVSVAAKIPRSLPSPHVPDVNVGWLRRAVGGRAGDRLRRHPRGACRSRRPSPTKPSRSSTTTGRSSPRVWPTSPAASSRCLPGSGSLSRSAINFQAGANDAILRDCLGHNGSRRAAAVRSVCCAVRSATRARRTAACHGRAARRLQAADLYVQGIPL